MYTVPFDALLQMSKVEPHEELMDQGILCVFMESMGRAVFVSHQWISSEHPDPNFEQLEVLQNAMKNLLSGACRVNLPPAIEILLGRLKCPTPKVFRDQDLYFWYDYFCCPQGTSQEAVKKRNTAIGCIPAYVTRCYFFLILCPPVLHAEGHRLGHSTWASRGWCRLERMAREMARDDGYIIEVKSALHLSLVWNMHGIGKAPGNGHFSFEADRLRVGQVLERMVWGKLHHLFKQKDFHNFRFLLNMHHLQFDGIQGLKAVEGLVPHFSTEIDPSTDPQSFAVARFLHENCFKTLLERDAAGWSPLCYAVVKGDAFLVTAMLEQKANSNECLQKSKTVANLPKKMPVLCMAAAYNNNRVLEVLLSYRADVNAQCGHGGTALAWTAVSDNSSAVSILCNASANPGIKVFPQTKPFRLACAYGSTATMKEMMQHFSVSLRFCLHTAMIFFGDADTVSCLLQAEADINEQLRIPVAQGAWWSMLKMLHFKHYLSPSVLTSLAYHHYGATPLMFSILAGKFEATATLVAAGANLDVRNARGKTAMDLLKELDLDYPPLTLEADIESEASDATISI